MEHDDRHSTLPAAPSTDTRAVLLEAAIEYMSTSGPAVNFDAIAAEAGYTKGALYHHFGSVEGLVEEVFKEAVRRHAEQVIAASEARLRGANGWRGRDPRRASTARARPSTDCSCGSTSRRG